MAIQYVHGTVNYIKWKSLYEIEKPFQIFTNIPPDAVDQRDTNLEWEPHDIEIYDASEVEESLELDTHGFTYRHSPFALPHPLTKDYIESQYLPYVEQLLRKEMKDIGFVYVFDWRLRRSSIDYAQRTIDLNNQEQYLLPSRYVHIDQAPPSVVNRVRKHLPGEAESLLKGRVRIINVWRPLNRAVENWPLALCDGRTVVREDLVECDHISKRWQGSTFYLRFNPSHSWYYLKGQTPDEIALFKIFDSSAKAKAAYTPHVSFQIDKPNEIAAVRESIEVRAFVFGGDG